MDFKIWDKFLVEEKPQKGFEGQPVSDLVFQFGVRGDAEPILKRQAFEQHQGRVGAGAFLAGSHGVMAVLIASL